jgi:hypothetical protein
MLIPNKFNGYSRDGVRLYPFGGGGGGGEGTSVPGMGDSQIGNTGGTTGITGAVIPPASTPFVSVPGMGDSQIGNTGGTTGITGAVIPPASSVSVPGMGNSQVGNTGGATGITGAVIPPTPNNTQQGTMPTGRPAAGSSQFYQPVYQPQYQNYNMGNPMGISQFGQQPSFGGFMPQMQTPFNPYTNSFGGGFMPQQQFQPQMSMQTPFSSGMSQPPRTSSGPARAIVSRSAGMRGTPNVMRRAEGGITSLMDKA